MAGGCLFAAVWLMLLPPPAAFRLLAMRRAGGADTVGGPGAPGGASAGPGSPGPVTSPASAGGLIHRLRQARWPLGGAAKAAAARRASVVELCDGIATELAAGRPPGAALASAADVLTGTPVAHGPRELAAVADAARAGGDVPAALEHASRTPGYESLRLLAGCWRIGVERGGMLADVIEGLADALRDEREHRDEIALQLAGPRATARMLAGLPVLGLLMAMALGAHPFGFLLGTLPGGTCLCLGLGLDALGLWWTHRIAAAAESPR